MKPETFELLLNSYLKERIPDFDNLLYDASGADHVFQGRKSSLAFAPNPLYCSPTPIFAQSGEVISDEEEEINGRICTDSVDGPRNKEQETCRFIAKNLSEMADEFEQNHLNIHEGTNSSTTPREPPEGIMPEEWSILRRIYSDDAAFNVSRIATILADGFTPQTFQGAVTFISERVNDLKLQFTLVLELTAQVVRRLGTSALDIARGITHKTYEQQIQLENLQPTEENVPE